MGLKKVDKYMSFMEDSMKGLFMIVKGQYRKTAPVVTCKDGEERFIGGYDPANEDTSEWYQLMDRVNYETISCGSSLENMLKGITRQIVQYNNDRGAWLHDHSPITEYEDETGKKSRRVTVSPITRMMMEKVEEFYGDFYDDQIAEAEEEALRQLAEKPRKTLKKTKPIKNTTAPAKAPAKTKESPKKTIADSQFIVNENGEEELPFISEYETKVGDDGKRHTVSTRGGAKKTILKKKSAPSPKTKPKEVKKLAVFKSI